MNYDDNDYHDNSDGGSGHFVLLLSQEISYSKIKVIQFYTTTPFQNLIYSDVVHKNSLLYQAILFSFTVW